MIAISRPAARRLPNRTAKLGNFQYCTTKAPINVAGGSRGHHVLRRISNEIKETAVSLPLSLFLSRPLIHPAVRSLAAPFTVCLLHELPFSDVPICFPARLHGQVDARWQVRTALSSK